jgi:hypothetical protein
VVTEIHWRRSQAFILIANEQQAERIHFVIPAKAGIQSLSLCFQGLDPGLRRGDECYCAC